MIDALFATLGSGDCEALGDGWLVQPVNAWSSLAYAVVGIGLAASGRGHRRRERNDRLVLGVLLAATGFGSFLYHGPQPVFANFAHDLSFLATLWFLILVDPSRAYGLAPSRTWIVFAAACSVIAAALLLAPDSTNLLTGVSVVALLASDLTMHRIGGIAGRWYGLALVLLIASLIVNALGRSAATTCWPEHLVQFHGAWHILSATAFGAYFVSMTGPRERGQER